MSTEIAENLQEFSPIPMQIYGPCNS